MPNAPAARRATYTHPSLPACGTMTGVVRVDEWEGQTLFFPDAVHLPTVEAYGYEGEGGLYLEGADVVLL